MGFKGPNKIFCENVETSQLVESDLIGKYRAIGQGGLECDPSYS
jgi:hypothetical protein